MNEYVMNNFGFTKNLRLPFSTPNYAGSEHASNQNIDRDIICRARVKPEKFKLISEIIEYLNF